MCLGGLELVVGGGWGWGGLSEGGGGGGGLVGGVSYWGVGFLWGEI